MAATGYKDDNDLRDSLDNDGDLVDLQKKHQEAEDFKAWENEFGEGSKEDFKAWEKGQAGEGKTAKEALGDEELDSAEDDEATAEDEVDEDDDESSALAPLAGGAATDFYNPSGGGSKGFGGNMLKNRGSKVLILGGVLGLTMAFGAVFGFLNTFRLKHLMENMNFHAFNKYNAAVARRSDKWVQAYTKIRLMEWEGRANPDGDGNAFFRANKVDTNNPIKDWYRTMRTSSFEDDLLKNQGIRFTSAIDKDGKVRPAVITIKGHENRLVENGPNEFAVIGDLDTVKIDKLANSLDTDLKHIFDDGTGGNKAARLAIRDAVDKETHKWQVIKRRHTRKAIANMTGVRDWRFFDKTRTKVENKKNEFKAKMIKKVFPKNSRSSNFLLCVLGLGGCTATTDASNPENKNALGSGTPATQAADDPSGQKDANGNPIPPEPTDGSITKGADAAARDAADALAKDAEKEALDVSEKRFNKEFMDKITKQFTDAIGGGGPVGAVKKILDWALKFENNLGENKTTGRSKIGDAIYMARLTGSLMVAYATISTITDQMQSGEVDPDQVNAAMQYFDGAGNSEAFNFIFNDATFPAGMKQTRTNPDGTTEKVDKCATGESFTKDDLVPFCDQFKPNGGSKVSGLEDAWNKFVSDSPLGAILSKYKDLKNNAIFGFFDKIGSFFGDVVGKVLTPILNGLGITDAIGSAATWLSERVLSWVGVKPCMTGAEDTGGMAINCILGGASGAAESASRTAGGVLVKFTDPAYLYSKQLAINYNRDTFDSMSTYDKYFAMDNQFSLASNLAFGLSMNNNPLTTLGSMFSVGKNFSKGFGGLASVFSGKALAQSVDEGFRDTAQFSGVDTYAITQNCVENDPLSPDYIKNATNSKVVSRDINTLGNSDAYSAALYTKNGDDLNEQEINDIYSTYNCAALDNVVRGGLGYAYGYTGDDGYSSSSDSGSGSITGVGNFVAGKDPDPVAPPAGQDACPISPTIREGSRVTAQKGDQQITIKLCVVHGYLINLVMAKNFDDLYTDLTTAGFKVEGSGGNFRTNAQQATMHANSPNSSAPPGRSNHELGLAVDTQCSNADGTDPYKYWTPGESRGLAEFKKAIEHKCLNWIHNNSVKYSLLLQCDGKGSNGEIAASTGGCETWHLSPTGK